MKKIYLALLFLNAINLCAQKNDLEKASDKLNDFFDKNSKKVEKGIKEAVIDPIGNKLNSARNEYDESNFNYAISFSDNAALYEAEEKQKGKKLMADLFDNATNNTTNEKSGAYQQNSYGEIAFASKNYKSAEYLFKDAIRLYKVANMEGSKENARAYSNLALLYVSWGKYNEAEEWIETSFNVWQKIEPNGINTGVVTNNKGVLMKEQGKFEDAEALFNKAIAIHEKNKGKNSIGISLCLNNKAMLFALMGKYDDAIKIQTEALQGADSIVKKSSSNYIRLLTNLAYMYKGKKDYALAEETYNNALKTRSGGATSDKAQIQRGLASLYLEKGDLSKAISNYEKAYSIFSQKNGSRHPSTIGTLNDLATVQAMSGNVKKARKNIDQVLDAKKNIYGENHPEYIRALEDRALIEWQENKIQEASNDYKEVLNKTNDYIQKQFASMNEYEKTKFVSILEPRLQRFASFVIAKSEDQPDLLKLLFNNQLNNKALLLSSSSKIRQLILNSGDAKLKNEFNRWLKLKEDLSRAYALTAEELEEDKIDIAALEKNANDVEKNLAKSSAEFSEALSSNVITFADVAKKLNADEAAMEIIRINHFDKKFTGDCDYAFLILKNDGSMSMAKVNNGNTLENEAISSYIKNIKELTNDENSYQLFWQVIEEKIGNTNKLFISPDGVYNQLSILTLKNAEGKYLVDTKNLSLVSNSKEIIILKNNQGKGLLKTASLFGYPDYGKEGYVADLPGTKTEIENISKILKSGGYAVNSKMKLEATEANVKNVNPGILHIATHGFFLADANAVEGERAVGIEINQAQKNPLLRSGLLLANCEKVLDDTYGNQSSNNGVLTAYEVMNMNLSKTDLVVMSACETGLGQVVSGEGVYGLQRAFLVAGAKSVIMSLWTVSDDATMLLMTNFYQNMNKGKSKLDAFYLAQKQVKLKYPEPFYWGAFVMMGK
jgi:CHAT domain-containing protein/Tfp pilus assembly protein PilF